MGTTEIEVKYFANGILVRTFKNANGNEIRTEQVTTKTINKTVFIDNFNIFLLNIKSKNKLNSKVIFANK